MRKVYLESSRISLRSFSENDEDYFVDLDRDPQVMKYLTDGRPTGIAAAQETLARVLNQVEKWQGRYGVWIAIEKETEEFVGWFLLRPPRTALDDFRHIEVGYRLKRKYWGRGFATEVSKLLIEKAFHELNAETVFATAMALNSGSINVMKKVGMKFHSEYIENEFPGENKSAVKYVLTRSEWLLRLKDS
jgi:RimJ/RimL family protein N-acetyltransferase